MSLKVESKIGKSDCLDVDLFDFLSDFTNFVKLLPPQHQTNIQATTESCTIGAGVMGNFTLIYFEKERPKLLKIGTEGAKENILVWIQLKALEPYNTAVKVTISLETGFMAKMIIKGQIQQLADSLVDAISQIHPNMLT